MFADRILRRGPSLARVLVLALAAAMTSPIALTAIDASAQTNLSSKERLRQEQDALFAELQQRPDDPELMFRYARVSAELENYEGAISTLQRLLLFRPNDTQAKVELGALYFAIGSYAASEKFFREALESPELDDDTRQRIGSFLTEIERRTAVHRVEFEATVGVIASTNASFGPGANEFNAVDGGTLTVSDDENEDIGTRARFVIFHSYDLGRANEDRWDTEFDFDGRWWSDSASLNFASGSLRTGPTLGVDSSLTGLKVRPFIEVGAFSADNRIDFYTAGGGVEASSTFGDLWSASAELRALWKAFGDEEDEDFDGVEGRALASVRYAPTRDLSFRLTGLVEREDAQISRGRSTAGGVLISATLDYVPPFDLVDQEWTLDLGARAVYRRFDAPDPDVETGTRDQIDLAVSASHRFQVTDAWSILAELEYQIREASSAINEFEALTGGLSISWRY